MINAKCYRHLLLPWEMKSTTLPSYVVLEDHAEQNGKSATLSRTGVLPDGEPGITMVFEVS